MMLPSHYNRQAGHLLESSTRCCRILSCLFSLCRETTLLFFGFLFLYGLATLVSIYSGETLLRRLLRGIATRIHNIIYKLVMVVVVIIITVFIVIEDKAFSVVVVSVRTTTPVGDVDLAGWSSLRGPLMGRARVLARLHLDAWLIGRRVYCADTKHDESTIV